MKAPNPAIIQHLRESYPKGARVRLDQMDDVHAPPIGTEGTIIHVDSLGTVHVKWDNGSTLGVAWPVDKCTVIRNKTP